MLARDARTGATFTVARLDQPTFDTAVTPEQLAERYFVQETDIGSLGLAPADGGRWRCAGAIPFAEEYSFSLDTDRSGWAGYTPNRVGVIADLAYEFRAPAAPT